MKKVISYSLWGKEPKYNVGAIRNAITALHYYPGWECWYYCANDVPQETINSLAAHQHVKVIKCSDDGNWKFTTIRFLAISEPNIERVIFRDCDNRFSKRELAAVNEWISSEKTLHIMKDHPYHGTFPILAGQWGLTNNFKLNMSSLLNLYHNKEQYHYDQFFLASYVWRFFENDSIIHDEIFAKNPFPIKRENLHYIGEPHDENDNPCFPQHRIILKEFLSNETN